MEKYLQMPPGGSGTVVKVHVAIKQALCGLYPEYDEQMQGVELTPEELLEIAQESVQTVKSEKAKGVAKKMPRTPAPPAPPSKRAKTTTGGAAKEAKELQIITFGVKDLVKIAEGRQSGREKAVLDEAWRLVRLTYVIVLI